MTCEPGNLSSVYGFPFGGNCMNFANLGGGGSLLDFQRQGTSFQAPVMTEPQIGGEKGLWIRDPNRNLVEVESIPVDTRPPSGYYGFHNLSCSMSINGTQFDGGIWASNRIWSGSRRTRSVCFLCLELNCSS